MCVLCSVCLCVYVLFVVCVCALHVCAYLVVYIRAAGKID